MRVLCFIMIMISACQISLAQDISTHMLDSLLARNEMNPAYRMKPGLQLSILNIHTQYHTDGMTLADIIVEDQGGLNNVVIAEGLADVSDQNFVDSRAGIEVLQLGVATDRWQLSAGYNWMANGSMVYTDDLANLLGRGNAPYIGKTLDISTSFAYQVAQEIFLGAAYHMSQFSIGMRLSYIGGVSDLSTDVERNRFQITTDEEFYALTVDTDLVINSAGTLEYEKLDSIEVDFDLFNPNLGNNKGFGVDIGVVWDVNDQWSVSASVRDIGRIQWSTRAEGYESNIIKTYDGIDILDYIDDDNEIVVLDTLSELLEVVSARNDYETQLGVDLDVVIGYKMSDRSQWKLIYSRNSNHIHSRYSIGLTGQYCLAPWLEMGLGYALSDRNNIAIPSMLRMQLGPLASYITSDNLLGVISPSSSKMATVRLGLGFTF